MFYSPGTGGFYHQEIHGDNIPADAREITRERYEELLKGNSEGKMILPDANGDPVLTDQLPQELTVEQVEANRLRAYADPVIGSDRFFAEVARMQAMGEEGWEAVKEAGVTRYAEIQSENPWPKSA